jgi:hypothetical protein
LTTGADGTATLTAVVCTANGYVSWAVNVAGTMDAHAVDVPAAGAVEGTTIYCTTPGTDTITLDTINANLTAVTEQQLVRVVNDALANCDPAEGNFTLSFNGEVGDAIEHNANSNGTTYAAALNSNANLGTVTASAITGGHTATIIFEALTGNVPMLVGAVGTSMGVCTKFVITEAVAGVHGTTFDFIDDDLGNNSIVTWKTVQDRVTATGAPVVTTNYQRWTYDSTDTFAVGTTLANQGQTEAAFEAANALLANLTTEAAISYRTGATTTGSSYFQVG